jgi:hypothetical protein
MDSVMVMGVELPQSDGGEVSLVWQKAFLTKSGGMRLYNVLVPAGV